jgi:hypothetical protein
VRGGRRTAGGDGRHGQDHWSEAGGHGGEAGGHGGQATLSAVNAVVIHSGHPAAYDVLVGLHVLSAVIGFGAVAISGAYGAVGRNAGRRGARAQAAEEVQRYFSSGSAIEYLVLVAPLFGVAAMSVRPGGSEFGQLWVVAGLAIWVLAGGLLTAMVRPAERRIRAAGADVAAAVEDARRLTWAAAASDLLFVAALLLMVTQPA